MKRRRWSKIVLLTLAGMIFFPSLSLMMNRAHHETKVGFRWRSLSEGQGGLSAKENDESMILTKMEGGLPPVARRYLSHTILPGAPLAETVKMRMSGALRRKGSQEWTPFEAEEVLAGGRGLVWKAKLKTGEDSWLDGADYYYRGKGQVRFFHYRFIPSVLESGLVVDRSMAGRVLIESIWLPSVFLPQRGARWENMDNARAKVTLSIDDLVSTMTMVVEEDGRLREVVMPRYHESEDGNIEKAGWRPFGIKVEEEKTFERFRIPSKISAGWWYGTERYA
ncbi:MAG: hypothetical protein EHM36_07115, partial [Deltaproteobacteria bacterium]